MNATAGPRATLDQKVLSRAEAVSDGAPLLVGLSGGGDSTALLLALAQRYPGRVHALVVDHALRVGSAEEAAAAAEAAKRIAVPCDVRRLSWPTTEKSQSAASKPGHAALRRARHAALYDHARALGACCIALGHTADDQAETILMRAARGSDWQGLAGMRAFAPAPIWPEGRGLWIMRPFLHVSRESLREALRARGTRWIEDPSNQDARFARPRARAALANAPRQISARLASLADKFGARAEALDLAAGRLIAAHVAFEAGDIHVLAPALRGVAGARALAVLVAAAGASEAAISLREAATLRTRMARESAVSLAGATVRATERGLRLTRDIGAVRGRADGARPLPTLSLERGEEAIWDNRLALTPSASGWVVEPGARAGPVLTRNGAPYRERTGVEPEVRQNWLLKERAAHLLGGAGL